MSDAEKRKRSCAIGYLMGLAGTPRPLSTGKKLVGYLYNGVGPLPGLPEWDREAYPYACIQQNELFATLHISGNPIVREGSLIRVSGGHGFSTLSSSDGEWGDFRMAEGSNQYGDTLIWANHDILNTDGSVHLAASEPVPVYE